LKGLIEFEIIIGDLVLVYKSEEGWESNHDSAAIMIDMVALNESWEMKKLRNKQHTI
jgi:hypothetical protein